MRAWFHFRFQLVVGDPVPAEALAAWRMMQLEYPDWPLFRPERCSSEDPKKVRRMVDRETRKLCVGLERLDREFRKRQADNAKPG
jgi:hypothetical protein